MELKLFTELIDSGGKATAESNAITNLHKVKLEAMHQTLDENLSSDRHHAHHSDHPLGKLLPRVVV